MSEIKQLYFKPIRKIKGGENHDQKAWAWRITDEEDRPITSSVLDAIDVGMNLRDTGWVNIMDLDTDAKIIAHLNELYNKDGNTHIICASKHGGGVITAMGDTQLQALKRGLAADVNSPFGGFPAFNKPVEKETAEFMNKLFIEGTLAPDYNEGVLPILTKKENRILMKYPIQTLEELYGTHIMRFIAGGILVQERQNLNLDIRTEACIVAGNQANDNSMDVNSLDNKLIQAAQFVTDMQGMITSNTILFGTENTIFGVGNGVGNRYFAARNARASMEESLWNHIGDEIHATRALAGIDGITPADFEDILDPNFALAVGSDAFYPKPDALIESLGVDRVNPAFSGGRFRFKSGTFLLKRDNFSANVKTYDRKLIPGVVVQPGVCGGDSKAKRICNDMEIPMIFLVNKNEYLDRKELKKHDIKVSGARRFSH